MVSEFTPPWLLKNGLSMMIYAAFRASQRWEESLAEPEPPYQEKIFSGKDSVPIFGLFAVPDAISIPGCGTIIATYGITGDLDNQWFLRLMGRKAFAQGYAVVLFDWRAHGKTAELSPVLTSDGLNEGEDFVRIAAQAKALGCPAPYWFTGYSLGGQLALWAIKAAQTLPEWGPDLDLSTSEIGGGAVICPSLDSNRSLSTLVKDPLGQYLERAIAREVKKLARRMHRFHPEAIDAEALSRVNSIWSFDHELVIRPLGFSSVEDYYEASSALNLLPDLTKPTFILYAADDPLFDKAIIPELKTICENNSALELVLTQWGGHVGYISSKAGQREANDPDRWWAWNRILDWFSQQGGLKASLETSSKSRQL